jgi:hypothetical protein
MPNECNCCSLTKPAATDPAADSHEGGIVELDASPALTADIVSSMTDAASLGASLCIRVSRCVGDDVISGESLDPLPLHSLPETPEPGVRE